MQSSPANASQPGFPGLIPQISSRLPEIYEQSLRLNRLVAATCSDCQRAHFPPRSSCTHCRSGRLEPMQLSGRAKLHSAEIAQHPGELSLGHILLEEGFWVRALLVGAFQNPATLAAGLNDKPVDVAPAVLRTHGLAILAFKPA